MGTFARSKSSPFIAIAGALGVVASLLASPALSASAAPRTVSVSTAGQLKAALAAAKPGQTIKLADGTYKGQFFAEASGTASAPITLTGSRKAVLTTGTYSSKRGYGLRVTGDRWRITGLTVRKSGKGIVLDGSRHTVLRSVKVGDIGYEGVHFRSNSSDSAIVNSLVHDTGRISPAFGEGIYIGSAQNNWKKIMGSASTPDRSDRVLVKHNKIVNIPAEGIDIKEGTTGSRIFGNRFSNAGYSGANHADSWVDIKGNGHRVAGNTGSSTRADAFQVHATVAGWGKHNTFARNSVSGGVPGYTVRVHLQASGHMKAVGTVVTCGGTKSGRGMSNIPCSNG